MTAAAAAVAARPELRVLRYLVIAALAVLAVMAADYWHGGGAPAPQPGAPLSPAELRPGPGPRTFADALANAEREVAGARIGLEHNPGEWLRMEKAARALLARYRLTGQAADLAEADRVLERAMGLAPWPAGPALSQAAAALSAHDLDLAERSLERFDASGAPPSAAERLDERSLRCEIAYQRGNLAQARRLCGQGDDLALALRRANLAARSGDTGEAARLIEDMLRRPGLSPQTLAMLSLQRASVALAEGDWQASGRWARAAERAFPGYWLSEAYVAQQFALEGDRAEARRRYAALAERTGDAAVFDALARLAAAEGQSEEARGWAQRAGAAWRERSRLLPLAYASHYSEHLLLNGDPRAALELAAADYRVRPHPTTIVHYALALWRTGDPERALDVVHKGEAGGFLTADMKLAEAVSLGALGRAAEAGEALAAARRLNPRIDSFSQQFVAFAQE
jgi:hypothetical protein